MDRHLAYLHQVYDRCPITPPSTVSKYSGQVQYYNAGTVRQLSSDPPCVGPIYPPPSLLAPSRAAIATHVFTSRMIKEVETMIMGMRMIMTRMIRMMMIMKMMRISGCSGHLKLFCYI